MGLIVTRTHTFAPTTFFTLANVKEWLRVDFTTDDDLITNLINQSVNLVEEYLNRAIIPQTINCIATKRVLLELPYGPIQSITSVKDEDGTDLTYEWNGFEINFSSSVWSPTDPDVYGPYVESYTIYEAGPDISTGEELEGDSGLTVAIYEVIALLYENRGDSTDINSLLWQHQNLMPYRKKVWI